MEVLISSGALRLSRAVFAATPRIPMHKAKAASKAVVMRDLMRLHGDQRYISLEHYRQMQIELYLGLDAYVIEAYS